MNIGYRTIAAIIVAIVCAQPVLASGTADRRELIKLAVQSIGTALVTLEIESACLIQITPENREYVANEPECRESLTELESVISENEDLEGQIDQVKRFRAKYSI